MTHNRLVATSPVWLPSISANARATSQRNREAIDDRELNRLQPSPGLEGAAVAVPARPSRSAGYGDAIERHWRDRTRNL
jgi:hypothetical protein